ncbi:GNAT family N-acetyltransferase [Oceanirhabdus sp. W0125-5]|uniref:GNAT family N-acetyltransferase n=1 Tax=Oceanirhabdus sp. W0125-5 TaxID=2999116 RepID=UPI0022F2FC45|nr:GNAT family N-acetyltransferase [Oceanirhabdus sp. W0125-5]WBW95692.1 GNAT family N-acetyltransferase [Oceanirhabdus sp. W0125-5]
MTKIKIKRLDNYIERKEICNNVLRALPEWFGIEESIEEYNEGVKDGEFFGAYEEGVDKPLGFISFIFNNQYTAELYVTGVFKEYHNMGIGKKLLSEGEQYLKEKGVKFLMVKTLGESHPDKNYAKTREFYLKTGFTPLQEIKEIWGKENPCLIMVKNL